MFLVNREEIAKFSKKLYSVVTSKASAGQVPYYGGVKIGCNEHSGFISIKAYGSNIDATAAVKREGSGGSFSFGTRAEQFNDLIQALPKSATQVSFEVADGSEKAIVRAGGSKFEIRIFKDDIFPPERNIDLSQATEVSVGTLMGNLKKVAYCRSTDLDRDAITYRGLICINREHFVATDGYRLSFTPNRVIPFNDEDAGILLSADKVDRLLKIYDMDDAPCKFMYNNQEVVILGQNILTVVRRSSSRYPNYQTVIPGSPLGFVLVNREELYSSISRSIIFSDSLKTVRVSIIPTGNILVSSSSEHGSSSEQVISKEFSVPSPIEFNLNGKFLVDSLKNRFSEIVRIEFRTDNEPVVIKEGEHTDIILPIRSKGE